MPHRLVVALVLGLLGGCATEVSLVVDLRTDYVLGQEVDRVRVFLDPGGATQTELTGDGLAGVRVAELDGLTPGSYDVVLTLFRGGEVVDDRTVRIDLREPLAITVLLTRDCRDVSCDAELTCRAAMCVDPRCSELEPELCGDAQCSQDSDCVSTAACAAGLCEMGACAFAADDGLCEADEWCNPSDGCLPRVPRTLPGEDILLAAGWTAEVWQDFTSEYTFVADQFTEDVVTFSNRPHHAFLLQPPFAPGLGLVASAEIYELTGDAFVSHPFRGAGGASGPDSMWDAEHCGTFGGAMQPGICVGAESPGGGDGLFRVEADWSISLIGSANNVGDVAYDETGAFDALGTPEIWWGGPDGLRRWGALMDLRGGSFNGATLEVLPSGDLIACIGDELTVIESVTHAERVLLTDATSVSIAYQLDRPIRVVAGDFSEMNGFAYVIVGERQLVELDAAGGGVAIATSDPDQGWIWTHAVAAPSRHPLAVGGPTFYVLEYNPMSETNRVFRLVFAR